MNGQEKQHEENASSHAKTNFICESCERMFPSKNALFKHLRLNVYNCLPESDALYVTQGGWKEEKVAILYGYRIAQRFRERESILDFCQVNYSSVVNDDEGSPNPTSCMADYVVSGGESASQLLLEAIQIVSASPYSSLENSYQSKEDHLVEKSSENIKIKQLKTTRSYGCSSRNTAIVAQDDYTPACTEVLTARIPILRVSQHEIDDTEEVQLNKSIQQWILKVNKVLVNMLRRSTSNSESTTAVEEDTGGVVVFGRISIPKTFNAELDLTLRKVEYMLPADFFFQFFEKHHIRAAHSSEGVNKIQQYCDSLLSFQAGDLNVRPDSTTLHILTMLKKLMQRFTTNIEEFTILNKETVTEKKKTSHNKKPEKGKVSISEKKKKKKNYVPVDGITEKTQSKKNVENNLKSTNGKASSVNEEVTAGSQGKEKVFVLRRKRYHNFTPHAMAHEFLAFRRMDRFHHAATERFGGLPNDIIINGRPFLTLSLSGDMFLTGQVQGVVGLLIAICKGVIDDDILDCIFDEEYPTLVPVPVVPYFGIISREANYATWEGRAKAILTPRRVTGFDQRMWGGWSSETVLCQINSFYKEIKRDIANTWMRQGVDPVDGRLLMEKMWTKKVLEPWAAKAVIQLEDYRQWKSSKNKDIFYHHTGEKPQARICTGLALSDIDTTVPKLFENVLNRLREADKSGLWPKTTPKRQLVMVSSLKSGDSGVKSLAQSYIQAKANRVDEDNYSAYSFVEGEGGASGSFSVGAMPGHQCVQPKANTLFPELMKAAFELELAICPAREPSSTIAINRNAQFRPHTDSGAGSGQSNSLIVGLGNYLGGELVVEGVKHNIRYRPMEFNGWTERHWTLPFQGERYSLVWFTPKGCEGIRGIDLCG